MTNKAIVDIAVLAQDLNQPYKIDDDVPIYDLLSKTPVLSVENFLRLFYSNGINNNFCVNNNKGALTGTKQTGYSYSSSCHNKLISEKLIDYISFKDQSVMRDCEDEYDDSLKFNLKDSIFSSYSSPESGLGVCPNFWTPCSRIELTEQLLKICYLFSICNVCCSLTFTQALESIISENTLNLFENSIVKFRVSVVFTNDNEFIKDVIVRFNYLVDLDTGRELIPKNLLNKLINNPCDATLTSTYAKGCIKSLRFLYSDFYNKNNNIALSDIDNWEFESDHYYSRPINILKKMIVPSDKFCNNICKKELDEDSENNILFKIRIKVSPKYYECFNKIGYVDQTKLCIELLTNTDITYCIGDTINLAVYDKDNIGECVDGQIIDSIDSNENVYPVSINKIFKYKTPCKSFITFEDIKCNPLLLTVCKIC